MNKDDTFKAIILALILGVNSVCAMAQDTDDITGWQTPLAAEFARLDTSGNGLILPNEASKGKAFNKKSFAEADVDHDGTIDEEEYIQYKLATSPKVTN